MSTDEPFTPPNKKHNVLWWIGGGFALLVFIFVLQLFGPNPPIIVSPQTTHITSPLGADGLPDYERYILEESRKGVTPENNAATLIWQALWPGELDSKDYAAMAKELGLEGIPSQNDSLRKLYDGENRARVQKWLQKLNVLPDPGESGKDFDFDGARVADEMGRDLVEEVIGASMNRPWTSAECPPLAAWVAANKMPLNMLVEASKRPRCYFPSPSLLNRERESLVQMLLPGAQTVREAGRALPVRAMLHLGEGRVDEAWQDLLSAHRIGHLVGRGGTMVEQLVGIAIDGIAREGTVALLDTGRLSPKQARQIQRDLESLPNFSSMADSLDSMERLSYLDAVTVFTQPKTGEMLAVMGVHEQATYISSVSVDWNIVLRKGNEYYDRCVATARMTDRQARNQASSQLLNDLGQLERDIHEPATLAAGVISRQRRSEIVAGIMLSLFLPAINAAMDAQDRANAQLDLLRMAAALAVYRAEHGTYPETLDELVPGVLPKLPVDLYNAKPFIYRRTDDGYLLYTLGENGVDDGGSNKIHRTLNGQPLDQFEINQADAMESQIPGTADDFSIRVPTPKWEPPKRPAAGSP